MLWYVSLFVPRESFPAVIFLREGCSVLCCTVSSMSEQKCLVFNWNVRGLNNKARRKVVKDFAQDYRCTIATLQETKLELISAGDISETLGARFSKQFAYSRIYRLKGLEGELQLQLTRTTT